MTPIFAWRVWRWRAIGCDVKHFAEVVIQFLRDVPWWRIGSVAGRQKQIAVAPDREAAAGLGAKPFGRHGRLRTEDHHHVGDGAFRFVKTRARDVRIAVGSVHVVEKRKEDSMIARKVRIEGDVEQADVLRGWRLHDGHAGQWLGQRPVGIQNAHRAR